jgi:hypothetical protein
VLKQVDLVSGDESVLDEIELNPAISDQVKQIIKFDKKLYESLILDFMQINFDADLYDLSKFQVFYFRSPTHKDIA